MKKEQKEILKQKIIQQLNTIEDLEVPISIYELGLIYDIFIESIDEKIEVTIHMTQINLRCNSNKSFLDLISSKVESIEEIDKCKVKLVFSPKWDLTMISPEGLKKLRQNAN
ncbi:metal-sulfur cluster assembly factor [Arcobacter arenosus]|jgi:metal-sulfur cluster biosynthetic enzyme|uniref:DUF59 domain-containing protein n=1 Tax=Arcobacter arenosus TaxID=2576037 RepID=A0A5R8Y3U3_9BACT|nr:metal-sulfur cluster assembly factor [Arcobacter arenosus]TLP40450.1 DUF59 domain-containing protein [Arcobacter arenosus]